MMDACEENGVHFYTASVSVCSDNTKRQSSVIEEPPVNTQDHWASVRSNTPRIENNIHRLDFVTKIFLV